MISTSETLFPPIFFSWFLSPKVIGKKYFYRSKDTIAWIFAKNAVWVCQKTSTLKAATGIEVRASQLCLFSTKVIFNEAEAFLK